MRRYLLAFFVGVLYIHGAMADVGVVSRTANAGASGERVAAGVRATSRATSGAVTGTSSGSRTVTRPAHGADTATGPSVTPRATSVRTAAATRGGVAVRPDTARAATARTSRPADTGTTSSRRAGVTQRTVIANSGARAKSSDVTTSPGADGVSDANRAARGLPTAESIAAAKVQLERVADLNQTCQAQYNDCMDQFCSVIDNNQKRCSCSSELSKYATVEDAVQSANTRLNEVAQRIRYIGLSADEIRAIMSETEAELALNDNVDTSESRKLLDEIADMIKDPKMTTQTTSSSDTLFGLDMDLDFSTDDTADIFSLDFLNTNTSAVTHLRGRDLYNAAKKRCRAVLNQCEKAGATESDITGNYDLAIDKDCLAYEKGLEKMNQTLLSNVRSANLMLQKARLAVLQNNNQYDAKDCVGALETCMLDDMVCGADYKKCLDPTKKYIDENGNVVLGQNITNITAFMQNYDNARIDSSKLSSAYAMTLSDNTCAGTGGGDGSCVIKYLLQKIGTGSKIGDANYGLCRPVMDKCRYYTYDSERLYRPYNDIVVNYVQRALVSIRAAQRQIISDYASACLADVAECYNNQVTQVTSWSTSADVSSIRRIMAGACRNVALTCAYAIFTESDKETGENSCSTNDDCIANLSQIFYQSLLCPENSTWTNGYNAGSDTVTQRKIGGWVNTQCRCNDGYFAFGGACLPNCNSTSYYVNNSGVCTLCAEDFTADIDTWSVSVGTDGVLMGQWPSNCVATSELRTLSNPAEDVDVPEGGAEIEFEY